MRKINGGSYQSFFVRSNNKPAAVPAFYMSTHAVTNAEYLAFVKANPQWRKSRANKLWVDAAYLRHWKSDTELNPGVDPNSPVVFVSWFAATAYSRWKGERLPATAEWEWAGAARFIWPKGLTSQSVEKAVLAWYEKPSLQVLPPVQSVNKNAYGLYDMHGLVWEWVSDFNSFIGSFDSRGNAGAINNLFCAAGSLNAADKEAYASYLRYSYRGSLKGRYCIANLGFRTARNL
ncbi:MAG TPA: formylglycine-generating enzyme family protein [Chitinophagaceae bacterium]